MGQLDLIKVDDSAVTTSKNAVTFTLGDVDCFEENEKLWFKLSDIGKVLELSDGAVRKMKHDKWFDNDEINTVTNSNGGADILYVAESALYRILNKSNSPKARPFERWVTREVIPSIRKTGRYEIAKPTITPEELEYNSKVVTLERAKFLKSWADSYIDEESKTYRQVLEAYAMKEMTGDFVLPLPKGEKTYSATEVGKMFGISANKVGSIAKANNLKVKEYGEWYHDKAKSGKEVSTFRYNEKGLEAIRQYATKA